MKDVRIETKDQQFDPPRPVKEISTYLAVFSGISLFTGFCLLAGLSTPREGFLVTFILIVGIVCLLFGLSLLILAWQFRLLRHWTYPFVKLALNQVGFRGTDLGNFRKKIKSSKVRRAFGLDPLPDEPDDRIH